jgi:tetratricopeptide (TPR) repeat protein
MDQVRRMSGQIFISYRREESRWSARSLHDRLCRDFDPKQIFIDIDAIALGEDFVKAIETTVAKCDVLIAVIGNNWLDSKDDHGDRRLDNPEDFVRMEIGAALKREIRVIPVLVDGALMPRSTDLPEDLKALVRHNALPITDTSFDGDCQRLAAAITLVLEEAAAKGQERGSNRKAFPSTPEAPRGREGPKRFMRLWQLAMPVSILRTITALMLIVVLIWFVGSLFNHIGRKTPLLTPTPIPSSTPSSGYTPGPTASVNPFSEAMLYYKRGLSYYHGAQYALAINAFNEAIRLAPGFANAYYYRGLCYREQGKESEAEIDFDNAKQLGYAGPQ